MMHTFDCRTILEHSTRAIVLVVWLLNSWGCAFIRGNVGDEINEASVANLKKGTTTRRMKCFMRLAVKYSTIDTLMANSDMSSSFLVSMSKAIISTFCSPQKAW